MSSNSKSVGVGLMGLGVIGGGIAKVLTGKPGTLTKEAGNPIVLKKVLEIDSSKHGTLGLNPGLFTTKFTDLLNDPEIQIVVELIGGENPAFEFISQALLHGKHVVTANKEVMAKHWRELLDIAQKHQVALRFEASVGGGIPLIAPFQEDLVANDVSAIHAIVNGTTNYILTQMDREEWDFSTALKQAQKLGYAEADPTKDIEGVDAAYKLTILANIAFGIEVSPENVHHDGISKLEARDFRYARELGYAIKLLAIAKRADNLIETRVHPVFIPEDALLAKVDGVYNAIQVEGDLVGRLIFYGQGAGPSATSSAVAADIISIAQDIKRGAIKPPRLNTASGLNIKPMSEIETRYYLRMSVNDRPGVLAQIAKTLGDHSISIASVIQKETDPSTKIAEIVIMTHRAKEQAVQQALKEMQNLPVVKEISNFVRVEA